MSKKNNLRGFNLQDPVKGRTDKPRTEGLTMVLDKGLGLNVLTDLVAAAGRYIDYLKLSFGTSIVFPQNILQKKIEYLRKSNIDVYPGGTLFEVAVSEGRMSAYLDEARKLGFTTVEVSNGTLEIPDTTRKRAISKAKELGLKVLTEVGKKDKKYSMSTGELIEQIEKDLFNGADKVIIEGRESGKGISIYKNDGSIDITMFNELKNRLTGKYDKIIWETPLKKQQVTLIKELGSNVNLGNINYREVIALETLRRGLRGDTFRLALDRLDNNYNHN